MGVVYDWQVQAVEAVRSKGIDATILNPLLVLTEYRWDALFPPLHTAVRQLSSYWRLEGSFGEEDAMDCRHKMEPVARWENFGFETPHLQTLAIKVLSQVSSVAMCQEIWRDNVVPSREAINRLGVKRVEDLILFETTSDFIANEVGIQVPHLVKEIRVYLDETMAIVSVHDKL
ncbi:hypothetical protein QYF36_017985 [Acer negundo]|nr:hypothetical protein QYF36_017985 [Acer negundo]